MQASTSLGDAYRVLRLLLVSWVPFALVGTIMAVLLVFPGLRMELSPLERADFVAANAWRIRLGAFLFAARGIGELFVCLGLLAFARRLPYQPGVVAATVAVCASLAALAVDSSGAYLFGHVLPAQATLAAQQGGAIEVPDLGEGVLGAIADLFEQMMGRGRREALVDFVRVESLGLRRVGAYGSMLHIVVTIALYATVAAFERSRRMPSLTAAVFFSVVLRAVAAGGFYASVQQSTGQYPHLVLGGVALASAALVDVWMASAIGGRAQAVCVSLTAPDEANA